jgi:hypothetical protein
MKLTHFLVAAALCSTSAAVAQTTPPQTTPRTTTTASPSTVPSGTTPEASNPKGAVSPSEVFTTGSPDNGASTSNKRAMKQSKKDKTKTKM